MRNLPNAPKIRLHHFGLFIIFAIIIIVLAVKSGIYLYQKSHTQSIIKKTPLQQLQSTTTTIKSTGNKITDLLKLAPTLIAGHASMGKSQIIPANTQEEQSSNTNLLTYTNPSYKFSLLYPGNLQLKQTDQGLGITSVELRSAQNMDGQYAPDFQLILFSKTIGNLIGQNFDTFYAMNPNSSQIMKGVQGATEEQFTKLNNRKIAGLRAFDYQATSSPPVPNEVPEIGTYIEIDNNLLITATTANNKSPLEQMLASFKYPN